MSYTPPTLPLNVSWEGTEPYTPPAQPLDVSWFEGEAVIIPGVFLATVAAPIPPITLGAEIAYFLPVIAGTITDAMGNPAGRRIHVHNRATGAFLGATDSDPVTGAYQFQVPGYGEYQRVVLAEDESDPLLNDLIHRIRVEWPVE